MNTGEAWAAAKVAIVKKDFDEAERLRSFMIQSDSKLMEKKIEEARSAADANDGKWKR